MDRDRDCRLCRLGRDIWIWLLAGLTLLLLAWVLRDWLPAMLRLYLLALALLGLIAAAHVGRRLVSKLCRKRGGDPKGQGSESHPPSRVLKLPPRTYKRPDPRIYSQTWLMARGLAVTWDNPDIALFDGAAKAQPHALAPAHAYRIRARIWNGSPEAPAVNMFVRFAYLDFGIGGARTILGETPVDLPAKGAPGLPAIAEMAWTTPATPGHYCVQVELAKFAFTLRNDSPVPRALALRMDAYRIPSPTTCDAREAEFSRGRPSGVRDPFAAHRPTAHRVPADWRIAIDHDHGTVLRPFESREVTVDVTAPDGFAGSLDLNVNAFAQTADGVTLVGGVTLRAHS